MLSNRSIPNITVIPELACPDVSIAADWLCKAFGFNVRLRIGNHRIQLNVGEGALVLTELPPGTPVDTAHSMMIRVENVDAHFDQSTAHGAAVLRSPADHPYGERQYTVADPTGHRWTFTQSIADVDPVSWGGTPEHL